MTENDGDEQKCFNLKRWTSDICPMDWVRFRSPMQYRGNSWPVEMQLCSVCFMRRPNSTTLLAGSLASRLGSRLSTPATTTIVLGSSHGVVPCSARNGTTCGKRGRFHSPKNECEALVFPGQKRQRQGRRFFSKVSLGRGEFVLKQALPSARVQPIADRSSQM